MISSLIEVEGAEIDMDSPLMFDFDPLHNLLVVGQGIDYFIFIGDEPEVGFTNKYNSWMEKPKPKHLKFALSKSSILDNQIQLLAMKNMRLYLVDSEYSMIVFTITISE